MTYRVESKPLGFTLVELVIVIILVSTLSLVTIGLFAGRSAFSPLLAAQQLSSATLLAQQAALAGNASATVTIEQTADDIDFIVGSTVTSLERNGSTLAYRQQSQSSFTSIPSSGYSVTFDGLGRIAAPVARESINFRITGESQFELCLSSLGAVYAGTCQ